MRKLILKSALALFAQGGKRGVTMRAIADMIEYSPATIYNYFADKEAMLRELCFQGFEMLIERHKALGHMEDPFERLHAGCEVYLRFALDNPEYYTLMLGTPTPDIDTHLDDDSPPMQAFGRLVNVVTACVEAGRFEGRDPLVVSLAVWSTIHGLAHLAINNRYDFLPEDVRRQTMKQSVSFALRSCSRAQDADKE